MFLWRFEMECQAKATISVGDKTITFEGPVDFVQQQVARYVHPEVPGNGGVSGARRPQLSEGVQKILDERQMVEAKKPHGHSETVAVLAFCLAERGVAEFSEEEMKRAYIRAVVRPPKVMGQAIRDAKNNFDYIEAGSKRGTYRLSDHGERTVRFDLPRQSV
jgi:hypothetical protein